MDMLIGSKVLSVAVSEGQHRIKFEIEGGSPIIYDADGDCCSETWFAEINFSDDRVSFPIAVIACEKLEIPLYLQKLANEDNRSRQEYDQVYGEKIIFQDARGRNLYIEVIYRNSSNGYYGGDCSLSRMSGENSMWTEIVKDWSA
jgi:hypothetical protein